MALSPAEIQARKIARKQKQINTKIAQIAKIQQKKTAKQAQQEGFALALSSETDPKKIASLTKKNNKAIEQILKYNSAMDRHEAKRLQYAQELAAIIGPA